VNAKAIHACVQIDVENRCHSGVDQHSQKIADQSSHQAGCSSPDGETPPSPRLRHDHWDHQGEWRNRKDGGVDYRDNHKGGQRVGCGGQRFDAPIKAPVP